MPQLRKTSAAQRRRNMQQNLTNYRAHNREGDFARNSQILASRRENEEYRENERSQDRENRRLRRTGSNFRQHEQELATSQLIVMRSDPTFRNSERERDALWHSIRRSNQELRQLEHERDAVAHSISRSNPDRRLIEQERNTLEHMQRRQNQSLRERERERDAFFRNIRRSHPDTRDLERESNALSHSFRQSNLLIRSLEQERNTFQHSQRRKNLRLREIERERDATAHSIRRSDSIYRQAERERDALAHRIRRLDYKIRQPERDQDALAHRNRRLDSEIRQPERDQDALAHRNRRLDSEIRQSERDRDALAHRNRRLDPEIRQSERDQDALAHSRRRMCSEIRGLEREHDAVAHSIRRSDPDYRELERERDAIAHTIRRSDPAFAANEQIANTSQRQVSRISARVSVEEMQRMQLFRVRIHRLNPINRINENARQAARNREIRHNLSPESRRQYLEKDASIHMRRILEEFNVNIKHGPTEVCICCGGLWFPKQITLLNRNKFGHIADCFCLADIFPSDENIYKFCHTCCSNIKTGKTPALSLKKGFEFPEIPDQLKNLTPLEERFVAPRIPFMRIVSLGYNRQCAIRGAVVNVPILLDKTVNVLPRRFDQTGVIQVHLKRRMEYNHTFMTEVIRPEKIIEAARFLVNTELYRKHNVKISEDWWNNFSQRAEVPFVSNIEDESSISISMNANMEETIPEELNPQETLLENTPIENISIGRITVAPGEGQRPIDMLFDEDSEELSYPTIYCGKKRTCESTVGQIIKSEARRYDRRCARVDKVLYSYKKLELSRVKNSISTCLRKKIGPNQHTARNLLNENYLERLIQHDEGYYILKGIRSSPAHWEGEKKKVLAMIRQFGIPTLFLTLSAAESQWLELLVILTKVLKNRIITEEDALNYTTLEKYDLIRTDPITCSRYFDQRIRHLFKHFKSAEGIFGEHKVFKFYWRIEFQQRGSPHVHGIYWLQNAPVFKVNDETTFPGVVNFIDQYITTDSSVMEVESYISYQRHNHSRTCLREIRGKKICRFNIPYPPLPYTRILTPLQEDISEQLLKKHKENYEKIQTILNATLTVEETEQRFNLFENFLQDEYINLTEEEYIMALRSSLKKPRVFLKRSFKDKCINAFNPKILSMQRANIDIQFVLDAYACVSYIVNYINKSNRGVSRLLQEAQKEIAEGNFTVKKRLQHIANKFISASEISSQEASYNILGMHLSECSNAEVYINTMVPEKRVRILKSKRELQLLPEESTNIYQSNLLDYYAQRPDTMEDVCLAYFSAFYRYSKTLRRNQRHEDDNENYLDDNNIDNNDIGTAIQLRNNSGYIYKRKNAAIIRFSRFSPEISKQEYFRAIVMLYLPWRNEQTELLNNNNEQTCIMQKNIIENNRIMFEKFKEGELDEILLHIQEEISNNNIDDNLATAQILDDEFRALAVPSMDENMNIFEIFDGNQRNNNNDVNETSIRLIRLPPLICKDDLIMSIRTLNVKQRQYLHHLLRNILDSVTFCEFISGGAGVGKSRLIKTIYQSVSERFNSIPGSNPDLIKVLLSAPTGKAAFNIGGATLHALFSLPINQYSGEIRPLKNDAVNSILAKFLELKLIIIDEISMVGARMLGYLDARLKQIFKSTDAFGGKSLLVFGDLKQLSPVGDKWIFSLNQSNPYGLIAGQNLWNNFMFYELTEIMRQRDDHNFAQVLNSMALGDMEPSQIELIKSRVVKNNEDVPPDAIHLFCTNEEAEKYNFLRLGQILTNEYSSRCFDVIKSDTSVPTERILNMVSRMKSSETQGLCAELKLKTTAKYMMTVNINTSDGLVNGATGVLMDIDVNQTGNPTTLWVLFSEDSVGAEARRLKSHLIEPSWTPVEKCVRSFQYKKNDTITIERTQFPLVVAEGITIHKSQGATYSKVVVHTQKRMNRSALYVACSRATSASGLHIIGNFIPPKPLTNTDPVKVELERLRTEKCLCTNFNFLTNNENNGYLYFQNIQSLPAHHQDIATDPTIMCANIICLVETWTYPEEEFSLTNYSILSRLDCINARRRERRRRNRRGIIVYIKSNSIEDAEYLFEGLHSRNNKALEYTVFRIIDIYYIILYKSPNFPQTQFNRLLGEVLARLWNIMDEGEKKVYIVGDFNMCRKTETNNSTERFLNVKSFYSVMDRIVETTKHGTHIDWVFSNINGNVGHVKIYPTIHSYHDGIILRAW